MRILVKLIYGKYRSVNGCNRRYIQYPWIKYINMQYPCFKCTEFTLGFSYEVQVVCLIFSFLYCELFVDQHLSFWMLYRLSFDLRLLIATGMFKLFLDPISNQGPSWLWSWSYGSKIYDYLCNRSVPISTKVVGSSPIHGEVYSIQYYVIKFVSNLWQVTDFLQVLWFPPIKLTAMI